MYVLVPALFRNNSQEKKRRLLPGITSKVILIFEALFLANLKQISI